MLGDDVRCTTVATATTIAAVPPRHGGDENIPATGAVDDKGAEDAEPQQLTSRGGVGKYMRMGTAVWGIGSRISIPPCVLPLPLCSSCSANK